MSTIFKLMLFLGSFLVFMMARIGKSEDFGRDFGVFSSGALFAFGLLESLKLKRGDRAPFPKKPN